LSNADPDDLASKLILAEALSKKQDKNLFEAFNLYEEVASQYEKQGKHDQAGRIYKQVLEINPNHSGALKKVRFQQAIEKGGIASFWARYGLWIALIALILIAIGAFFLFSNKGG
jgi:Tfp pilus assembly protein PilF